MNKPLPDLSIPSPRLGWVDLLRILACFMMVLSHCCDPFVAQGDANRPEFLTGTLIGSLMRACVPLFVMMTAVLLLPVRIDIRTFYRKRIVRILIALVFWSLLLPVLYYLYLSFIPTASACIDPAGFTLGATVQRFWTFPLNFCYATTPLWYLYMLVGLYLLMPILSAWLEKASQRDLRLVLWIWGFTLLLPYIRLFAPMLGYPGNYGNMGLFGVCDWNEYGTFHYVSGFVGYLLAAYYMVKFPPAWSLRKTAWICIPTFIVGYLITASAFIFLQSHYPGNYAYLEIAWYFCGINVFMMTGSLFMLFRKLPIQGSAWMTRLAGATFGIYLCHFILVQAAYDLFGGWAIPAVARIGVMAVTAFVASFIVVWLMQQTSLTRRFVQ